MAAEAATRDTAAITNLLTMGRMNMEQSFRFDSICVLVDTHASTSVP